PDNGSKRRANFLSNSFSDWTAFVPPAGLLWAQIERLPMNRQQLEMSFDSSNLLRPLPRRHRRTSRARWWFAQMRQVIERALDSEPVPSAGAEQLCPPRSTAPARN